MISKVHNGIASRAAIQEHDGILIGTSDYGVTIHFCLVKGLVRRPARYAGIGFCGEIGLGSLNSAIISILEGLNGRFHIVLDLSAFLEQARKEHIPRK